MLSKRPAAVDLSNGLSIFIKFNVWQYLSEISHTESAELSYSLSMLFLKWGKDFTAFKTKILLTHITRKLCHLYPPAECCDQTLKTHAVSFSTDKSSIIHREEICAIKIIPISQKSRRVTQWSTHLISILVQAPPWQKAWPMWIYYSLLAARSAQWLS